MGEVSGSKTKGEEEKEMKPGSKSIKCPECGGDVRPGYSELVYDLEYRVRITNVPANVCSRCGETFISGRVASDVNRLVNRVLEDVQSFVKSQPGRKPKSHGREIAIAV